MDSCNAEKSYPVTCSKSIIISHGQGLKKERETDLEQIVLVRLKHLILKNVRKLGCCRSLTICILADNFITKIDALVECIHLVKLDLKGNQITQLPGAVFWDRLQRLLLLNLHDNNMATRENIHGLSGCQNLAALTLYDTPISLKGHYRHCMVNSIWSLKALDNYVISDEEIIDENRCLPFRFKALQPHFYTNLYLKSKMASYQREMQKVHEVISAINRIQSHHSPTLIIQRYIRGYLTRKRLGLVKTVIRVHVPVIPPEDSGELTTTSEESQGENCVEECLVDKQAQRTEDRYAKTKNMFINIMELAQLDIPEELEADSPEAGKRVVAPPNNTPQHSRLIHPNLSGWDDLFKEELGMTAFRVHGFPAQFHLANPVRDMLVSRRRDGYDVRRAIRHFHAQRAAPARLPPLRPPPFNAEKRLMSLCHGSVSMAPFREVERAYRMQEQAEALRCRKEHVSQCQAWRDGVRDQRHGLREACRKEVLQERRRERVQVDASLVLQQASRDKEMQAARRKHAHFLEEKRRRASERAQALAFSGAHAMLTKGISKRQAPVDANRRNLVARRKTQDGSWEKDIQGHNRKQCVKDEATTSRVATLSCQPGPALSFPRPRPECLV